MMRRAPNQAKMQERMAQRQAALKHSLELSPAQKPAWNTFIATTLKQTSTNYYVIGTCP